ncbi:MAG: beta-glucosidase [Bacteroidota bacterium]|jgi:beta-glucosidase
MKKYCLIVICFHLFFSANSQNTDVASKNFSNGFPIKDIDVLLSKMSIEEKVGQMSQVDLGVIAVGDICNLKNPQQLDISKLETALNKYHVGSILNVGCGSGTISLENWKKIISAIQIKNQKSSNYPIPVIYGIDAIHGANYVIGATLFPQQIAQAATWNPQLVKSANDISAYETRAAGIPWNFSPVLDLGRQPLWSRFFETYGEDVCLAKSMAVAAISGLQSNVDNTYHVAACMKHFLGYSFSLSGHDRTPAWISDRELREYFLPTFQAAINVGAKTVMINSGEINGTPVHANYDILTKLLRDELKFTGVAVTDWEDIYKLVDVHHVAASKKEAVKMAIMAGIDMSMTPNDFEFNDLLIQLVKEGSIPQSRIDLSVKRILNLKKELGLFDNVVYLPSSYPDFGSKKFSDVSYNAASEAITLLKNNSNVLPLTNKNEKLFICGPAANSLNLLNGAWTHTWQGVDDKYNTKGKLTILEGLRANFTSVNYLQGTSLDSIIDVNACIAQAKNADKIIVCLGELPCTEIPGNINDLTLPAAQLKLVDELSKLNKPIILVCCFNRPRIIHSIVNKADAIVYAYLPGDEGGRAIADCIAGIINPSGKLPFTYPKATNEIVHYDHKSSEDLATDFSNNAYQPEFDFGFGMSYTHFTYADFKVSSDTISNNDSLTISIKVTNDGKLNGKEVVQLYYKDLVASITPSVKKLVAFEKVDLSVGQSRIVNLKVAKSDFSFINKDLKRVTEEGTIELMLSDFKHAIYVK